MNNIQLDLSHNRLSITHDKKITKEKGFMFKDLQGNPMVIKEIELTTWTPKDKKNV